MELKLDAKKILDNEFHVDFKGYRAIEVDEFLDDVIKDYEAFMAEIERLKAENANLKKANAEQPKDMASAYRKTNSFYAEQPQAVKSSQTATNLDILKRISRLEKEVFGKQIRE